MNNKNIMQTSAAGTSADPHLVASSASSCCGGGGVGGQPSSWLNQSSRNSESDNSNFVGDDTDLARELNALTVQEREKVFEDVHGVAEPRKETQEFIQNVLSRLETSIGLIPTKDRRAYNKAVFLKPSLRTDTKFQLMFLRAEEYNVHESALRLVRYFEEKLKLFGEQKLVKRITMDDLDGDAQNFFRCGNSMVLPVPDHAGRPIFFCDTTKGDIHSQSDECVLKTLWYNIMTGAIDETAQKRGICQVTVVRHSPVYKSSPGIAQRMVNLASRSGYILKCLPFRYASQHIVSDNMVAGVLLNAFRVAMGKESRLRLRIHLGSAVENEYKLMTFGIQYNSFLQRSAEGDSEYFQQYVDRRIFIDKAKDLKESEEESKSGIALYPKPNDVLLGRGAPFRDYIGNKKWNQFILSEIDRYMQSPDRFAKVCISMEAVQTIKDLNGRFLERTTGGWKSLDATLARKRAALAFQNKLKALGQQRSNNDSTSTANNSRMTEKVAATAYSSGPVNKARRLK